MKRTEDYETITIATKVSKREMSTIKDIIAELGFSTPYEFLKFVIAAMVRHADTWHNADTDSAEAVNEFYRLFAEIKDKRGLIAPIKQDRPKVLVAVHNGGQVIAYRLKGDKLTVTRNVDKTIEELHRLTHPTTTSLLETVAKAYGLRSIPKTVEQLAKDASNEIGTIEDEDLGYAQTEYGEVPKRTRVDFNP